MKMRLSTRDEGSYRDRDSVSESWKKLRLRRRGRNRHTRRNVEHRRMSVLEKCNENERKEVWKISQEREK